MASYITEIASWQGQMFIGALDATTQVAYSFDWLGDVEDVNVTPTEEFDDFVENWTGYNFQEREWRTSLKLKLTWTMNNITSENLGIGFDGEVESITGATVSDEILNNSLALEVGKYYPISKGAAGATAITIEDSTAVTPLELVANTHYLLTPCKMIHPIAFPAGVPTLPWKVTYTHPTYSQVHIANLPPIERAVRIEGMNIAIPGVVQLSEFYRVQFKLTREMMLLAKQRAKIPMEGSIVADMRRWDGTSDFSTMFGRMI